MNLFGFAINGSVVMKEIIFQQSIVIDPYEEWEHEQYTIKGTDISLFGCVESNFEELVYSKVFGDDVKRCVKSLYDKLGYDMYDNEEYKHLIDNTLSQPHIKFKRDEGTGDNTLYSWEEWQKIPYTRICADGLYGYQIEDVLQHISFKDIKEVLSSNNPLIKLIANCLVSSNDAHLRVRQMIKDGCDVDIEFLVSKGMYFGGL